MVGDCRRVGCVAMREPVTDVAAIAAEIADIRSLAPDGLRRRWRAVFGRKPPVRQRCRPVIKGIDIVPCTAI